MKAIVQSAIRGALWAPQSAIRWALVLLVGGLLGACESGPPSPTPPALVGTPTAAPINTLAPVESPSAVATIPAPPTGPPTDTPLEVVLATATPLPTPTAVPLTFDVGLDPDRL